MKTYKNLNSILSLISLALVIILFSVPVSVDKPERAKSSAKALVFFRNRDTARILHSYLYENLLINGGVLDSVVFVVNTTSPNDIKWINKLVSKHSRYYSIITVKNFLLAYKTMNAKDVYFRINDDVVFIRKHALKDMLSEYLTNRWSLLSANVIDHQNLDRIHVGLGAVTRLVNGTYMRNLKNSPLGDLGNPLGDCRLRKPSCSIQHSESFFKNYWNNGLDLYDINILDIHSHGYVTFDTPFILMDGYTGHQIEHDEREEISRVLPKLYDVHAAALGSALVARMGLPKNYDSDEHPDSYNILLHNYEEIAKNECKAVPKNYWETS